MFRVPIAYAFFLSAGIAQVPAAKPGSPRFEVAAVHPGRIEDLGTPSGCDSSLGLLRCSNVTLKRCIVGAYGALADRVLGGPDWIDTDRFQITARPAQPAGDKAMMAMLKTLLAERFKLALHRETRRGEVMFMEIAKTGSKLQPGENADPHWNNMHDHLDATNINMTEFAEIQSRNLNLPILDRTGLTGAFTFTLHWNPNNADTLGRDEAIAALRREMSIEMASQLGLTLKARTAPVEVLVVDHAERPSAADK